MLTIRKPTWWSGHSGSCLGHGMKEQQLSCLAGPGVQELPVPEVIVPAESGVNSSSDDLAGLAVPEPSVDPTADNSAVPNAKELPVPEVIVPAEPAESGVNSSSDNLAGPAVLELGATNMPDQLVQTDVYPVGIGLSQFYGCSKRRPKRAHTARCSSVQQDVETVEKKRRAICRPT